MTEPYFASGPVTLYRGDCIEIMRELPDESVDAVVTDPPYNLSFMSKPWDALDGVEDAGFAYWLAGLIDGEGHFAIKQHTRGTHAPHFTLKMRADERGTLGMIRRKFGHGTITEDSGTNPMLRWSIGDKAGCQALVDMLDKYPLRAKKMIDFWTWRAAVIVWTKRPRGNRWHGAADDSQMAALREALMERRHFDPIAWSGNEFQDWCRLWARECYRLLKPGGHLLSFGGSRTWHRLAGGIEDAGFEIRDSVAWIYGSGFPKSLNVGKDSRYCQCEDGGTDGRTEGLERGSQARRGWPTCGSCGKPQVAGLGTALKPSFEPIVVARKPLVGTVAANVLAHGTGAINIDAARIPTTQAERDLMEATAHPNGTIGGNGGGSVLMQVDKPDPFTAHLAGRWPSNVVLDESQADELDRQSGVSQSTIGKPRGAKPGDGWGMSSTGSEYADAGGASRFFPIFRYEAKAATAERPRVDGVQHPTVKPIDLMSWLVRLVTPPGGVVLEPFAGSGTTLEAAVREGMSTIGIEREAEYLPLIMQRLSKPHEQTLDLGEIA